MTKPGSPVENSLFSELGRIRKRSSNSTKQGRGLLLLLVTIVCTILLTTRLVWCFMFLFSSRGTDLYVESHKADNRRDALRLDDSEKHFKHNHTIVILVGRTESANFEEEKTKDDEAIELELELERKEKAYSDSKTSDEGWKEDDDAALDSKDKADDDIKVVHERSTDLEGRLIEEKKLSDKEMSAVPELEETSNDLKLADNEVKEGPQEDAGHADNEENPIDEETAEKTRVPDAVVYLEELAGNLAKAELGEDDEPYHSRRIYLSNYAEMKRKLRIFVYPHDPSDPYLHIFQPKNTVPSGNYASEEFFHQALLQSSFVTKDASKADFFYMPLSITKARLDKRISVNGLQSFCKKYVTNVRSQWSYWNRSNGADHFYLSCHSVARNAMDRVPDVRHNAIQLLCPASYFLASYISHKDASVPQIWPRGGETPKEAGQISQRTRLAFFAGALNSVVRQELAKVWANDDKILVHKGRVPYPYSEALTTSKFCLHAKGFEVNTARLGDAMFYGCVPVVIANYYDLPFQDVLDWSKFSIVLSSLDITLLKQTLEEITPVQYAELHKNVMNARKHFQWHTPPQEHDAFHTVMYELWKRRHVVRHSLH